MSDLLGGFGGLLKGLSGFMPQDDPDVKLMTAQSEVSDLQKQETELYAQIGRQALAQGCIQVPELESRLRLVQENLSVAQAKLQSAQSEKEAKEVAKRAEDEKLTCPSCGNRNPDGVKFCQECGGRLGVLKCSKCGASLAPGTRFCGECGARQEG
jgi:ribosomal protein L40E